MRLSGFLFCYRTRQELNEVYQRVKDLNVCIVRKSFNLVDVPYPWTLALICPVEKLKKLDKYLVENPINFGDADTYAGEARIKEFIQMIPLNGKYEPGVVKIKLGYCPRGAVFPLNCMFCEFGHVLECHHPLYCEEANCSHFERSEEERREVKNGIKRGF